MAKSNFHQLWDAAELSGQKQLSEMIREDVKRVQNAVKPSLGSIRHSIEDALMDQPDASFEEVVEWVAYNWGYTADGLLKKYLHLQKYFDKVNKDALQYRNLSENYNTENQR